MIRIICIGHPLLPTDNAGPLLFKCLQKISLPPDVELIDGGLQGLNLLRFFEDCQRVILIDNIRGYLDCPGIIHLQGSQINAVVSQHHDHSAGLAYLLALLPKLLERIPQIELLGIEGVLTEKLAAEATERLQQLLGRRSAA